MKNVVPAIMAISLSFAFTSSLPAQSRNTQRTQVVMANSGRLDLNATLIDLDRISQATQIDIASLNVDKWKSGWKTGFTKDGSHTQQAQQIAGSLRRNLANALPDLIRDVQNSRGNISTTFKLYDDVSLVCEALDSLINASEASGHKGDAASLNNDYSALTRVRRSLSNYIQQSSAAWETRGKAPSASFSQPSSQSSPQMASSSSQIVMDQGVKKIIVDDTVPEKKPAQSAPAPKKKPVQLTNLE